MARFVKRKLEQYRVSRGKGRDGRWEVHVPIWLVKACPSVSLV